MPTVTVDTSEDKQTFETDHDEDRWERTARETIMRREPMSL